MAADPKAAAASPLAGAAIAFDLDGTLVDTMPDLTAAVNLMLGTLGATTR